MSATNDWATVPLGQLLVKADDLIELDAQQNYRELTIRLWGRGVVLRRVVTGAEIASKRRNRVHAGQFILSRIDARNGAMGLVPDEFEGAVVSNDFPVFTVDSNRLLRSYIGWLSRTRSFVESCRRVSEGTTNRVRLKEEEFYRLEIPLPPLNEQRRIVAKIEHLAAKINEVHGLRRQTLVKAHLLKSSAINRAFNGLSARFPDRQSFDSIAKVARGKFGHRPRNDPRFYGGDIPFIQINDISDSNRYIRTFSQTLNKEGLAISRMFPKGTIVIAITGATVGVTGILGFDSCFPDSIVGYVPNTKAINPGFLFYSLEHEKQTALEQATQTTQPNINLRILNELTLSVPPLSEQRRIVAYLDGLQARVDELKRLQAQTAAELDALLPSILDRAFKGEL